jgi:molecular chaperone DnaK
MEGGEPKVIVNAEGGRTTPSVVAFVKSGEKLVGMPAKRQAVTNPENTVFSIKRFMGRRYGEVAEEMKMVPFKVTSTDNGDARVSIEGKLYSPPEVSALILQKLKGAAEEYLGEKVEKAVITVPAYFNDAQRQATKDAGLIAGLQVERLVNEPTAAALAYGMDKKKDEIIAVYDFGGGTFDISVLEVGEGVVEVKSTNGDTHLGGDNIDQRITDWILSEFKKEQGIDLSKDKMAMQRLKEASEKAKIELSASLETEINLPFITADASGPKHLLMKLTRARFEQMIEDIVQRSIPPCRQALEDAGLKPEDIRELVLVGGSTRIPMVQKLVKEFFGKEPNRSVNPDEVVAVGAAVQAAILKGDIKDVVLLDVTPLSLGVETQGGVMTPLIARNTTIPTRKSEVFTTAADMQTSVEIHVLQGERPMAGDNRTLARFHLIDLPPAPRGIPQIEVTFDIDANGIMNVTAKDRGTGREQKVTVTSSSGLDKNEVEKMVKDGESNAEKDKQKREEVEAKNRLDNLAYASQKTLQENRGKVSPETAKTLEDAIEDARRMINEGGTTRINAAYDRLSQATQKFAEALYRQTTTSGPGPGPGPEAGPPPGGQAPPQGDVIDADYVDADQDKKKE